MTIHKRQNIVQPLADCEPEIGRWLWILEDARMRTREALEGVNDAQLDRIGGSNGHSISMLLYHIAAIEADWLVEEVMEGKAPDGFWMTSQRTSVTKMAS